MSSTITEQLAARAAVAKAVADIYETAQRCADVCTLHSVPLPDEVARLLAPERGNSAKPAPPALTHKRVGLAPVPNPYQPPREGWISIALEDASVATQVLLAVRGDGPVTRRDIGERVASIFPSTRPTSLYAVIARLESVGRIAEEKGFLFLTDPETSPGIYDGRIWGTAEAFQPTEIAAHRREAIMAALGMHGVLVRSEISEVLTASPWVLGPLADSALKSDLLALQERGLIRRVPSELNEFKWELTPKAEASRRATPLRLATSM